MRAIVLALAFVLGVASTAAAEDARAQFSIERDKLYVGVPFQLELQVVGFDEQPTPELPKLSIPDATLTPLGATPNVSRSIQIINGRRSDSTRVTWSMRWRVDVHKAGTLRVPETTVTQGSHTATAKAGEAEVGTVPTTDSMRISLELPNRPVFVGETVPVTLVWLFQGQPQDQSFSVPLLSSDAFTASAPAGASNQRRISLSAGTKELQLPFTLDQVTAGGAQFNRLTTTLFVAPRSIPPGGKVDVAPSTVVAALPVGRADFFGNAPTQMFRATDVPRTLIVKPLPETDRPPTFAGAVGDQFAISVKTSRSVVQLGEPVELDVTVKSNQPLDTLSLGKLDGEGRLPKDKFTVPAEPPTGELSDEGKTKTFKITAQVTGPATEVPALAFSYFDPAKEQYRTIHSEPIALSVKGGSFVGAGDVVSAAPKKTAQKTSDDSVTVTAELALSSPGAVENRPLGGTFLWVLVGLLYALPLALFAARTWQLRTRDQREEAAEVRAARKKVESLLDRGASEPAREIAGPLGAALRELARVLGRTIVDDGGLIAKLETEAFAPESSGRPLSPDLRSDAAGLLRRWLGDTRRSPSKATAAAVTLLALALGATDARASADPTALAEGRAAFQEAMNLQGNATARKAAFARAEVALGEAVRAAPDRPELLADWGNAALGAGDLATAVLAYRRALALDPGNARARQNLAWVRAHEPDLLRPAASSGATDTLLFFHTWPRARKLIVGAVAFALAVLLVVPWVGRRKKVLEMLAVIPFVIWLAMLGSVLLEDRHEDDAVVMDDIVLRAADSAGAPAAMSQPLPRGTEVTVVERRGSWTQVRVANGTAGWVASGAVEKIVP